jgi:flagellar biogenesis protein FliO
VNTFLATLSLVIVSVEGRRLLLGLTSTNISLVTELEAGQESRQLPTPNTQLPSAELGIGLMRSVFGTRK